KSPEFHYRKSWNWTAPKRSLIQKLSRDLVLIKCRSPIYVQSAQRLSNSPKAILDSSVVAHNHPKLPDVPPHFHADVCSQLIFDLLLVDGFTRSDAKCRRERVQILFRCASFGLPAAHPVKTSTRIPILSP